MSLIKMLLVGYNNDEQDTCIDYHAAESVEAVCCEWEGVRGPQGFVLVATWTLEDITETVEVIRTARASLLRSEFLRDLPMICDVQLPSGLVCGLHPGHDGPCVSRAPRAEEAEGYDPDRKNDEREDMRR
jgi:hypothetical protein